MLKTILVPLDGSDLAEHALPYALTLARSTHADLFLVRAARARALPGVEVADAEAEAEVVESAETYLARVIAQVPSGVSVRSGVYYGDAARGILEEIGLRDASLVVMVTHGRTGIGRTLLGSVAGGVLRQGRTPLLLVHPSGLSMDAAAEPAPPM